jgi:hypothetical protein
MPTPKKHNNNAQRQAAYRKRQELARRIECQRGGLPPLPVIPTMPGTRRWTHMLEHARTFFEAVKQERDDYYDERSEAWQDSDKGSDFQEDTEALDAVLDAIDGLDTP